MWYLLYVWSIMFYLVLIYNNKYIWLKFWEMVKIIYPLLKELLAEKKDMLD